MPLGAYEPTLELARQLQFAYHSTRSSSQGAGPKFGKRHSDSGGSDTNDIDTHRSSDESGADCVNQRPPNLIRPITRGLYRSVLFGATKRHRFTVM